MIEWYFPWRLLDWVLRGQLIIWLTVVLLSWWVFWRSVVKRRPWLRRESGE